MTHTALTTSTTSSFRKKCQPADNATLSALHHHAECLHMLQLAVMEQSRGCFCASGQIPSAVCATLSALQTQSACSTLAAWTCCITAGLNRAGLVAMLLKLQLTLWPLRQFWLSAAAGACVAVRALVAVVAARAVIAANVCADASGSAVIQDPPAAEATQLPSLAGCAAICSLCGP